MIEPQKCLAPGKAIILDLDNTVFETKSIGEVALNPFFSFLTLQLRTCFNKQKIENIIGDLWTTSWDIVREKHDIPLTIFQNAIAFLADMDLHLDIQPFADYMFIKSLTCPKFLVTSSVVSLQEKKIKALGIEQDFERIIIVDPFCEAKTKYDYFKELAAEFKLIPEHIYVIGDSPLSEIEAGNRLGMLTVQILRPNVTKGDNAKYYINSFWELEVLLNENSHGK